LIKRWSGCVEGAEYKPREGALYACVLPHKWEISNLPVFDLERSVCSAEGGEKGLELCGGDIRVVVEHGDFCADLLTGKFKGV
jgi:hypothetical protein